MSADKTDVPRFLSQEMCAALIEQIRGFGHHHGRINLQSHWRGDVRWARNRVSDASDWRDNQVEITYEQTSTNQVDAASLRAAVQWGERGIALFPTTEDFRPEPFAWSPTTQGYPKTYIWSDQTYAQTPDTRSVISNQLIDSAERAGMLSAGYLSVDANGVSFRLEDGRFLYAPQTVAQCSMTVRDPQGTASGWAGASSFDWGRFDAAKLAEIALDKCLKSRNPVKIEPGRYTLIMEPQATFDFVRSLVESLDREANENPFANVPFKTNQYERGVLGNFGGRYNVLLTKLGQRVVDERVSITFDPLDPDLGVLPFTYEGDPYVPVTWIDHGVLTTLAYDRTYALRDLHEPVGKPNSGAFRLSGSEPPVTIDEMIATTKRGLLVTRFWNVNVIDATSLLSRGVTRDGLWLIENGRISKAVKNLRFTESPLFSLNNVEQIGTPVPVFSPGTPALLPPLKVRDFSFTSLVDAV